MNEANETHLIDDEARIYELGFHIVPTVGDEGISREIESLHALIAKHEGTIISEELPQLMRLAYPLMRDIARKKHSFDSAYFGWIVFEAFPKKAHAIKEAMRHNEHIIRSLLVKTEKDASPVRHPANAPRSEVKSSSDISARTTESETQTESKEPENIMTEEQIDAEIDKLIV
jgi:ribosomal protein S6